MRSTRYVFLLAGWLALGVAATTLGKIPGESVAWWLLTGLPAAIAVIGLAFLCAGVAIALYLALLNPVYRSGKNQDTN